MCCLFWQAWPWLCEWLADQIEIDYESGEILFKHEDGGKYPLFYLNGRARGIGTAPVMELGQTSFMALALKVGSFDTSTWDTNDIEKLEKLLKKDREEWKHNYSVHSLNETN